MSPLGSEYYLNKNEQQEDRDGEDQQKNTFRPICISNPDTSNQLLQQNPSYLPNGHCCPLTKVAFYIDSGCFLSSDCCGQFILWDTNSFTPVTVLSLSKRGMEPYSYSSGVSSSRWNAVSVPSHSSISSFDLPKNSTTHMQIAVGTTQMNNESSMSLADDRAVYLCDLKSGSTTQQLIGHGSGISSSGISSVQWSPVNEFILVSGGADGCIKLWDVRRSGSAACLTTLDQEMKLNSDRLLEYEQRKQNGMVITNGNVIRKKRRKLLNEQKAVGPGNYSVVQCSAHIQSHSGPVASLSFTPDGEYIVSASPSDGLHLWHIQKGYRFGILETTKFLGPNSIRHPLRKKQRKVPLQITQPGSNSTGTVWIGTDLLLGFDIHGIGIPDQVLSGHIGEVTSIASQDQSMKLFTGGSDGMILSWGYDHNDE